MSVGNNFLHIFVKIDVLSPLSKLLETTIISLLFLTQELRSRCIINNCWNLKNYEKENESWAVSALYLDNFQSNFMIETNLMVVLGQQKCSQMTG